MTRYLAHRVAVSVVVLAGISVLLFALLQLMPGDPVEMMLDPMSVTGDRAAALERLRRDLGLDQPIVVQYLRWAGRLLGGDLGYSYADGRRVVEVVVGRLGATVILMLAALLIGLVVGVFLGVVAALRRNSVVDYTATFVSMLAISIPGFFLGMLAIFVFAIKLGWFPTGEMYTTGEPHRFGDLLHHLALPAAVLGFTLAGPYARYVRSSMIDVLAQDFVVTATAKGLSRRVVVLRHGLRNALLPLVSVIAVQIPQLLAGAVVIEQIFAWPGMGRLALDAIGSRNYPIVLAFVMVTAVLVVACNLVADLLYLALDPRIRLGGAA